MKLHLLKNFFEKLLNLFSGRSPKWYPEVGSEGEPELPSEGVEIQGSVKTLLHVYLDTATQCSLQLWAIPGGVDSNTPQEWVHVNEGDFDVGAEGLLERATTSGIDRLYVEVVDSDGDVDVAVGPGVME